MNVLIIYPHGNALNTNTGSGTRVWNIINALIKHKNNVFILHSLNSIGNEDESLRKKCTVYYYRELKYANNFLR